VFLTVSVTVSSDIYTLSLHDALPIYGKIYTKNEFVTGADQSVRLMMGDYSYLHNNEFGKYSDRDWTKVDSSSSPVGIKRIAALRSEEHTSELQSRFDLVCRLLLEKKK